MLSKRSGIISAIFVSGLLIVISFLKVAPGQLRVAEQPPDVDKVIKQFAAKESEFQQARNYYTFRQEVRIQTLGFSDQPTGEFYLLSDILFDDSGKRYEHIIRAPIPTLKDLSITKT